MTKRTSTICRVLVAAGLLLSGTAHAYVDPYTGGMITSSLSTVLAAVLGFLSAGLVIFRSFLGRLLGNKVCSLSDLRCPVMSRRIGNICIRTIPDVSGCRLALRAIFTA